MSHKVMLFQTDDFINLNEEVRWIRVRKTAEWAASLKFDLHEGPKDLLWKTDR